MCVEQQYHYPFELQRKFDEIIIVRRVDVSQIASIVFGSAMVMSGRNEDSSDVADVWV